MPLQELEEVHKVAKHEVNQTMKDDISNLSFQERKDVFDRYYKDPMVVPN